MEAQEASYNISIFGHDACDSESWFAVDSSDDVFSHVTTSPKYDIFLYISDTQPHNHDAIYRKLAASSESA